jgi:hypothetical protein
MIVRILTEGQLRLPDDPAVLDELNVLDDVVLKTCTANDQAAFEKALADLLGRVRELGEPLADDEILESNFVLPMSDATLDEVAEMMAGDGLIPGAPGV